MLILPILIAKGILKTPTQILRRLTKWFRREIYQTQPELAECFPEKPLETAEIEDELEYTKKRIEALEGKLSYKASAKQYEKVKELLQDDRIEDRFFGYKNQEPVENSRNLRKRNTLKSESKSAIKLKRIFRHL